jgi:hypothetical protein
MSQGKKRSGVQDHLARAEAAQGNLDRSVARRLAQPPPGQSPGCGNQSHSVRDAKVKDGGDGGAGEIHRCGSL